MLKYLFTCSFEDGQIYTQNPEDISLLDPSRSCFYDVLKEQETNKIQLFCLADGENDYTVDLRDGSFLVNGVKLFLHELEMGYFNRRIIYYRRRTISFSTGMEEKESSTLFVLGWQGNDVHGNNREFVIKFY